MKNIITYNYAEYNKQIKQSLVDGWVKRILKELDESKSYLTLTFCDNDEIREINKQYRNKDTETDVLSFSQVEGDDMGFDNGFLGDIIISVPYAAAQGERMGHDVFEEVKYLVLHGVLHLLGYDHTEDEQGEMFELERSIFTKLTGKELV